ncbi:hypothetical protein AB0N06_04830 [Streptomyces sp. NPDC051020]|uniref:hypothetical protein n=1 Tax=Streptomyces sp. NPDC051020 TaxID=3155409 RepID=UPI0034133C95
MWRGPGHVVLAALLVAAAPGCASESGGGPAVGHPGGSARRTQAARAAYARKWGPATTPLAAADLVRAVTRTITDEGYAVARLEDYV